MNEATSVYIIEGWCGDQEWIEAVYATLEAASRRAEELRKTGTSELLDNPAPHAEGKHKFLVVPHKVLS